MLSSIKELSAIATVAKELLETLQLGNRGIRLLGISLSNLDNIKELQPVQLSLFE